MLCELIESCSLIIDDELVSDVLDEFLSHLSQPQFMRNNQTDADDTGPDPKARFHPRKLTLQVCECSN